MTRPGSLALLTSLILAGCASTPAYQAKLPETSANCVQSFESVTRHGLAVIDPKLRAKAPYVEFADVAQCLETSAGTTALALYAPDHAIGPAQVDISILPSPGGTFAAAVELLDHEFRRLERHPFAEFTRRGSEYSLSLFFDSKTPVYVMLVPDDSQVGREETMIGSVNNQVMVPAGPMMFMVNNGSETKLVRTFMAGGMVKLTMKPQGSATFHGKSNR